MGSRKGLPKYYGALAQLGARLTGSQEVTSSSLVRSTTETVEISTVFAFFGVVGFGWKWLDETSYARRPQSVEKSMF